MPHEQLTDYLLSQLQEAGLIDDKAYVAKVVNGLSENESWEVLSAEEASGCKSYLESEYRGYRYFPVANRMENDDIFCFVASGEKSTNMLIFIIHDYASPGWEISGQYSSYEEFIQDYE